MFSSKGSIDDYRELSSSSYRKDEGGKVGGDWAADGRDLGLLYIYMCVCIHPVFPFSLLIDSRALASSSLIDSFFQIVMYTVQR